ncbi:hypothetical protein T10_10181 [Trichinella papuae]|uniref:Uncharacterized protein n=1 Tax=Trichinella papuae TaxID=268474 RepID=A0A0V1MTG3_9BILA|nr:hypothetical protein T10_794 [Trichinella papuae]KRZ74800.1 hypothetical protein T10_10181 [Trichinella papuae]
MVERSPSTAGRYGKMSTPSSAQGHGTIYMIEGGAITFTTEGGGITFTTEGGGSNHEEI